MRCRDGAIGIAPFANMATEGAKGQALTEIGQAPANRFMGLFIVKSEAEGV
jgi:hypothetical protein